MRHHRRHRHQGETSGSSLAVRQKSRQSVGTDGAVDAGYLLLRRVRGQEFVPKYGGIRREQQLLEREGSLRVVLAGQPGSGAATSHRMHGSRRARVNAGRGSMGIRVRTHSGETCCNRPSRCWSSRRCCPLYRGSLSSCWSWFS